MTINRSAKLGISIALLLNFVAYAWGAEPPLGDPSFYPTSERPIGYRGDGNGDFPGAHVPTEWWEGTPVENNDGPDYSDHVSKNIVWKTELPSWGNCPPLVAGDKVFTLGEPDLLICVDAARAIFFGRNRSTLGLARASMRRWPRRFESFTTSG